MEELDKGDFPDCFSSYYKYIKFIGKGAFSTVLKVLDKYSSSICAVKVIKKYKLSWVAVKGLKQQAQILQHLQHPNIVKFLHVRQTKHRIFIAMQYIRGGTLGALIKKHKLRQQKAAQALRGILRAVSYLHRNGIVHRDLKPQNILVSDPRDLISVKIADFGLCTQLDIVSRVSERCGTMLFMAPEQLGKRHYSKEVDIWSCAIILYILLTGKHPLYEKHESARSYQNKLENPQWVFPRRFPLLAQNLFLKLVKNPPIERYSANQALQHPWISSNQQIPLTVIERMRKYDDQVKLRDFVYTVVFCSILLPKEFEREKLKGKKIPRFSEQAKMVQLTPVPKRRGNYKIVRRSKSPFRPMTANRGFRLKQLLSPVKQIT